MKFFKSFFKTKTPQEKLVAKLLKENNCACYCNKCSNVLSGISKRTMHEGIYRETCSSCGTISYFDYCQPAPLYLSSNDFKALSNILF